MVRAGFPLLLRRVVVVAPDVPTSLFFVVALAPIFSVAFGISLLIVLIVEVVGSGIKTCRLCVLDAVEVSGELTFIPGDVHVGEQAF